MVNDHMTANQSSPDPMRHQPLRELPALVVSPGSVDVRDWTVVTAAAERIGIVADLLVDIESLRAEYLIIDPDRETLPGFSRTELAVVSVETTRIDRTGRQVIISGVTGPAPEIHVRYRSTTRLAWTAAAIGAVVVWLAWLLGLFGRQP